MNNLFKWLISTPICFSLIFSPAVFASESMEAGSVLPQDSIVFSLDEADDLRKRIEELEAAERKKDLLDDLVLIQEQEKDTLKELLEIKQGQVDQWKEFSILHEERVKRLERKDKIKRLENAGWFILGIGVAGGAIVLGDKIGDTMERK